LIALWSETLQAASCTQDAGRIELMFSRIAIMLEIMIDRHGWPQTVRGLPRITAVR
jgi:hypothetical protein